MKTWTHERARVAALTRHKSADDPETVDAKRDLRAAKLADHVRRIVDEAPPLTDEQRRSIAALLQAGGEHVA